MTAATRLASLATHTVALEVRDAILTITISRPEVLNALSDEVITELRQVVSIIRDSLGQAAMKDRAHAHDGAGSLGGATDSPEVDWSIRGVVLTGAGDKAFIAGADISQLSKMTPDESLSYGRNAQELTTWLETLPVPVVAAVNGYALGGGCEFAMACDVIYASANAAFGQPEVALGVIPGFGGTVRLQQYVGVARARELILTGRRISAADAHRIGLVAQVFDNRDTLLAGARSMLHEVAAQSPVAVASAKHTIRDVQSLPTDAGLAIEAQAFARGFASADMREGTAAFLEKRKPTFPGR